MLRCCNNPYIIIILTILSKMINSNTTDTANYTDKCNIGVWNYDGPYYLIELYSWVPQENHCMKTMYRFETIELANEFIAYLESKYDDNPCITFSNVFFENISLNTSNHEIDSVKPIYQDVSLAIMNSNDFISNYQNYWYKDIKLETYNSFMLMFLQKKMERLQSDNLNLRRNCLELLQGINKKLNT